MRGPVIHEDGRVWCQFDSAAKAVEAADLLHAFTRCAVAVRPVVVDEFGERTEWRVEVTR